MKARWLFYGLTFGFAATLLAGAFLFALIDYNTTLEVRKREAAAAAQAYAAHTGRNLGELRFAVSWLAKAVDQQAADNGFDAETIDTARQLTDDLAGMSALLFIGADGRIKFSTVEIAPIGADVSGREYFKAHAKGIKEFIGPAIRALGTRQLVYTFSRRVERDGKFAGVTIASARVERWKGIISPLAPVPGTVLQLLHADGSSVLAEFRNPQGGELESADESVIDLLADRKAITEQVPVERFGLMAQVIVPLDAAMARWQARMERVAIATVAGLAALAMFGLFGYRLLQREAAATARLAQSLETERLLMGELEHRVKNSISLAASVLSVQRSQVKDENLLAILDTAHARIHAIAKAHERLRSGVDVSKVDLDVYLQGLCEDLAASTGVDCSMSGENVRVPTTLAISTGLVVTELLLNAGKHASADRVRVKVDARAKDGMLLVDVQDNAGGVPDDFLSAETSGLGMKIVNSLLSQLNGTLDFTAIDAGTHFKIAIPFEG